MEDELDAILSQLNYNNLSFFDAPLDLLNSDSASSANPGHAVIDSASTSSAIINRRSY